MLPDIQEKIRAAAGHPSKETVLELMNMYRENDEEDALLDTVRDKVTDILSLEELGGLDGSFVMPPMLMAIMLSNKVIAAETTGSHQIVDETGETYSFTTIDVTLSNGEIVNVAVVQ